MRAIFLVALAATMFTGCATSTLYSHGQKVAVFQGNIDGMVFHYGADGSIDWTCAKVNHSIATRAAGSVIGTTGTALSGIVTAGAVFAK